MPNNRVKLCEAKLKELQRETDESTTIVGYFNSLHQKWTDPTSKKINKDIINQSTGHNGQLHPIFFLSLNAMFTKTDHTFWAIK